MTCALNTTERTQCIDEIAAWADMPARKKFIKLLSAYFEPHEIVLIIRAAEKSVSAKP